MRVRNCSVCFYHYIFLTHWVSVIKKLRKTNFTSHFHDLKLGFGDSFPVDASVIVCDSGQYYLGV